MTMIIIAAYSAVEFSVLMLGIQTVVSNDLKQQTKVNNQVQLNAPGS